MPRPKGTRNASTLARGSDQQAFDYLRSHKGLAPLNAARYVRWLRRTFRPDGSKRGEQLPASAVTLDASVQVYLNGDAGDNAAADANDTDTVVTADVADEDDNEETGEKEMSDIVLKTPENLKDGGAVLAAMVAPHIVDMIKPAIAAAIADIRPVEKLVVINTGTQDRKELDGLHHASTAKVLTLVSTGMNVMLVGPAGCGKSTIAASVAKALGKRLTVISCSAGMSESQLFGRLLPLGTAGAFTYVESQFIAAYMRGDVILIDEIDGSDANLLLALNSAIGNGSVMIEARAASGLETTVTRHPETVIIAAANTWGHGADTQYVGRGALDVSTLDRFYRVAVDYDQTLESNLASKDICQYVWNLRNRVKNLKIRQLLSTRVITKLSTGIAAGLPETEVKADLTAHWSADERAKTGIAV